MNARTSAALVVVALAAGFSGGWLWQQPAADARVRAEAAEARAKDLEARLATFEAAAGLARPSSATLAPAGARAAAPNPSTGVAPPVVPGAPRAEAPPALPPAVAAGKPPRFSVAGREDALKEIEWDGVGEATRAMVPMIGNLAGVIAKGKKPTIEDYGRIQERNGVLLRAVGRYARSVGREENPNAAFTEPAFMVNVMASTLSAAGKPLTDAEASALGKLADRVTEDDARRVASYDDRAFALKKTLDDSESHQRFLDEAFALLTQEQRDVLVTPESKGRGQLDLFSSALMWGLLARPIPFADRDALVVTVEAGAKAALAVPADRAAALHTAVVEWADALPKDVLEAPDDTLTSMGIFRIEDIHAGAHRALTLYERVVDLAHLDDAGAKAARAAQWVPMPVHSAGPTPPR